MITTKKLLREMKKFVKKEFGNATIYRIAQVLDCSRNAVHNWEKGGIMDDEIAYKIAVLLKLDAEYVLACIAAERAKNSPAADVWRHLADRIKPAIAAGFCTFLLITSYTATINPFFA